MINSLFEFPNKSNTRKKNLNYDFLGYPDGSLGQYISPPTAGTANFSAGSSVGYLWFLPIYIHKKQKFDAIGMRGGSAGVTGANVRFAIYSAAYGRPSTPILDAGTIPDVVANSTMSIAINITLNEGLYYLAMSYSSAAPTNVVGGNFPMMGNHRFYFNQLGNGLFLSGFNSTQSFPHCTDNTEFRTFSAAPLFGLRIAQS